ncbi:hypothetical protein GGR55DRAFT_667837 [Xylaria sp. FL0064]|nr:hypothetical protein GGR55DRAFT_667837 [Xylaria sp. FL0064]
MWLSSFSSRLCSFPLSLSLFSSVRRNNSLIPRLRRWRGKQAFPFYCSPLWRMNRRRNQVALLCLSPEANL